MVEQPRLIQTGRAMATATLVSRVTGFVRTPALVAALGLGSRLLDACTLVQLPYAVIAVTVITATAVGAGLYALAARGLRLTELGALTAALRPGRA